MSSAPAPETIAGDAWLRRFVLALAALILAATIVELLFEEHTEEALQLIPFALCIAGLVVVIGAMVTRGRRMRIAVYVVATTLALGAILGMYLHISGNVEFEREISPNATTGHVLWEALHGASPLLAPGIILVAAMLAVAGVYRADNESDRR